MRAVEEDGKTLATSRGLDGIVYFGLRRLSVTALSQCYDVVSPIGSFLAAEVGMRLDGCILTFVFPSFRRVPLCAFSAMANNTLLTDEYVADLVAKEAAMGLGAYRSAR